MGIAEFRFKKTSNSVTRYKIEEDKEGKKVIEIEASRDFDPEKLADRDSRERKELKRELERNKEKIDPRDLDDRKLREVSNYMSKNRHNFRVNLRH